MWSSCPEVKIKYSAHVQSIGWMETKSSGQTAGTTGRGLGIEALRISVELPDLRYVYDAVVRGDCKLAGTC
ncbi:hypothetical protein AUC47_08910 [Microbacterium sp. SZ1]|nr:hypothetical protein AUC47_08910 [Microbacterium sp. SZ1]